MFIDHVFFYYCALALFAVTALGGWWYAYFKREETFSRLASDLAGSLPDSLGRAMEEGRLALEAPGDELDRLRRDLADKERALGDLERKVIGDGTALAAGQ